MPIQFVLFLVVFACAANHVVGQELDNGDEKYRSYRLPRLKVGRRDWPQWGGTSLHNNTPFGRQIPISWDVENKRHVKWSAKLGSQSYGSPIIANGRVYVGTNNGGGYIKRFPSSVDLGCLLCFDEQTGAFRWQYSVKKLSTGRVHDWPFQGIVSTPVVDGDRLWLVNNRGEVVCLDALGFEDNQNDGTFKQEPVVAKNEADVVWKYDMMKRLEVSQHNMCTCSCIVVGDTLFVVTGNGTDESHFNIPSPNAPAFIALNRHSGKLLWKFVLPGIPAYHGSWSSPSYAVIGGRPQVLFPAGDGWLYSLDPQGDGNGGPKLIWEFDCNHKQDRFIYGGRGDRDEFITAPVIYNGLVYVATGQDSDSGEGQGTLWCIDPAKHLDGSDVSSQLLKGRTGHVLTRREAHAGFPQTMIRPNPKSAVVWKFESQDLDGNGKIKFEEEFHRTIAHPTIANGLMFIADFSGIVHCMDAASGKHHWSYDEFSATWISSPLVVNGRVYVCDEDGDVVVFESSKTQKKLAEFNIGNAIYTTPAVANGVLFICNKNTLFAIEASPAQP
jgi:outer membrane protein assembly factor BamB